MFAEHKSPIEERFEIVRWFASQVSGGAGATRMPSLATLNGVSPAPKTPKFPRSYTNAPVKKALSKLSKLAQSPAPDPEELATVFAELMDAAGRGGLVLEAVSAPADEELRVRELRSTDGRLVLPLFTSIAELKATIQAGGGRSEQARAVIVPAREALGFVAKADFVAVQFDPRTPGGVVAREHIERLLQG